MKNILSLPLPPQLVPCVFRASLVLLSRGLETVDKSIACVQESPPGGVVGGGVAGGVVGGGVAPVDHASVKSPEPRHHASIMK
jgi:hypothetical protein